MILKFVNLRPVNIAENYHVYALFVGPQAVILDIVTTNLGNSKAANNVFDDTLIGTSEFIRLIDDDGNDRLHRYDTNWHR